MWMTFYSLCNFIGGVCSAPLVSKVFLYPCAVFHTTDDLPALIMEKHGQLDAES